MMKNQPSAIEFRTSRAKNLPIVIITPVVLFLFGFGTYAFAYSLFTKGPADQDWLGLLFGAPFFLLLYAEARLLRRVLWPDTLTLTRQGWTLTQFGRASSFVWAEYHEATQRWVPAGKSGSEQISLKPRFGGKRVYIPGEDFVHPFATVLDAVQQAQAGRLVEPPPARAPRLYAYVVVPLSALSTALVFAVVSLEAWRINHL